MTTRSGLSIRKIHTPIPKGPGATVKPTTTYPRQKKEKTTTKKYPVVKYKSLSYLSFVTRFIIALRVPELELAGVDPKETLEYIDENGYFHRSESESTTSSYSGCDSYDNDDISESEIDEVFEADEGVDYNGIIDFNDDDENVNIHEANDDLCESVNGICLNVNQNANPVILNNSSNLEVKYLGMSLLGCHEPNENDIDNSMDSNSFMLQSKNETQLPFICEECNKGFTLFSAYSAHVRSHTNQQNRCGVCGKFFARSWLLKGHMRTHTGERPFPCPIEGCDKAFADKSNLRSHRLTHSVTSKNFICEKCGRSFAQKRYLHKHMLEVCRLM